MQFHRMNRPVKIFIEHIGNLYSVMFDCTTLNHVTIVEKAGF